MLNVAMLSLVLPRVIMLIVIMLSIAMLNVAMLSLVIHRVIMMIIVMLGVFIPSAVVPSRDMYYKTFAQTYTMLLLYCELQRLPLSAGSSIFTARSLPIRWHQPCSQILD